MVSAHDPLRWFDEQPDDRTASRLAFAGQLDALDAELVAVASLVAETVEPVTAAFLAGDRRDAGVAMTLETEIAQRCTALEDECMAVLARQAPVAGDLRRVVAVLRGVGDVRRTASLLRHVAASLRWVNPPSLRPTLRTLISQLGGTSAGVFAGAVDAWRRRDPLSVVELHGLDDRADLGQKLLLGELYQGGQSLEAAVSIALVARYYERIADHGVELAAQLTFALTGDRPPVP